MVKSLWLFKNGRATKNITNFSLLIGKLTNFPYLCASIGSHGLNARLRLKGKWVQFPYSSRCCEF